MILSEQVNYKEIDSVIVDETVRRISSIPPNDVIPNSCIEVTDSLELINEYERDENSQSNDVLNFFKEILSVKDTTITFRDSYKLYSKLNNNQLIDKELFLNVFDYCEEIKLINSCIDLKECLNDLKLEEVTTVKNDDINTIHSSGSNKIQIDVKVVNRYVYKDKLLNSICDYCKESKAHYFSNELNFACKNCLNERKYLLATFNEITPELISFLWDKKEEYALLKGISLYEDKWDEVCKFVNDNCNLNEYKKTKESCIFHFVTIPILEYINEFTMKPFSTFNNQITTLIAFLTTFDTKLAAFISQHVIIKLKEFSLIQDNDKDFNEELFNSVIAKSKEISKETLELEKRKLKRLNDVRIEALILLINQKLKTFNDLNKESTKIRNEIENKLK
ncbi:hypothetical protein A0H76_619 [Hepatospora eriocheir]|uniref:Uncharacterized protein n=1 Tax=Hepatospora eriocheir TaxID=1081669 RepID=A0A1X0QIS3_9MICR|nr:hypothetical protein A0H76_619 [Hepatospora eriocheir]